FHFWDAGHPDEQALIAAVGKGSFYGACDPSLGSRTGKGDYSAIVILYKVKKSDICYVLAADIARRTPDETIERIIHYGRMYDLKYFGVEANHFQVLMVENLERRSKEEGVRLKIERIESRSNKQSRIANLEPEVAQGRIQFRKRDELLLEQLRAFPNASHDDGPDALEMAVGVARKPRNRFQICDWPSGEVIYDSDWNR
ncbi:MAG: phage terminase large subunit, partial [Planctomycetes bacterium]|nr:phage terminase large subunit [Planctomycetota bacterium]